MQRQIPATTWQATQTSTMAKTCAPSQLHSISTLWIAIGKGSISQCRRDTKVVPNRQPHHAFCSRLEKQCIPTTQTHHYHAWQLVTSQCTYMNHPAQMFPLGSPIYIVQPQCSLTYQNALCTQNVSTTSIRTPVYMPVHRAPDITADHNTVHLLTNYSSQLASERFKER